MRAIQVLLAGTIAFLAVADPRVAIGQQLSPNAPRDKPVTAYEQCQFNALQFAIAPYVARARASYPEAKKRYLAGLPHGQTFFVTVLLTDSLGRHEQVFIAVDRIVANDIQGRIWSAIYVVHGYHLNQQFSLKDADVMDWLITHPDGSEEGNIVGKFLDTYQPPRTCPEDHKRS